MNDATKENIKVIATLSAALALASVMASALNRCQHPQKETVEPKAVEVHDTITKVIHDTVPREIVRHVVRHDTVRVATVGKTDKTTADSLGKADSADVEIPIEQAVYHGSGYTAYVSGYKPKLDSIHLCQEQVFTTRTVYRDTKPKTRRFGLGLQTGYGITANGTPQPYIGVGVSCNILTW